jgi:hypothetical protein
MLLITGLTGAAALPYPRCAKMGRAFRENMAFLFDYMATVPVFCSAYGALPLTPQLLTVKQNLAQKLRLALLLPASPASAPELFTMFVPMLPTQWEQVMAMKSVLQRQSIIKQ